MYSVALISMWNGIDINVAHSAQMLSQIIPFMLACGICLDLCCSLINFLHYPEMLSESSSKSCPW